MINKEINKIVEILKQGRVILYPTDTIWGIGCDATIEKSVNEIYSIKKRNSKKSFIILMSDKMMLAKYIKNVPNISWNIIDSSLKPTTIIYENPIGIAKNAINKNNTIAIRIVKDKFCKTIIEKLNRPIISTSANISNNSTPSNFSEIDEIIKSKVYYITKYRQKEEIKHESSSIIKIINNNSVKVIRQ